MVHLTYALSLVLLLPSAFAAEYLVGVGKDETTGRKGMGFDPSVIHPAAGDVIAFEFRSGQHSVVQSTFENPCTGNGGFNTGVFTVDDSIPVDAPGLPTVRLTVNDTNPIWFFDEAGGLCKQGAVLAVNPTLELSAAAFKVNAANAPDAPATTAGTSTTDGGDSDTASSTATGTAASATNSTSAAIQNGSSVFGALLVALIALFW
ncbi:unnamed protein product [Cyclocybe aegerita]|uniref:Phytocyanin domain-containing protein n=1 Tax=Cyclocybe aegerita TaxID=1973307 RepID=A0A8S0XUA2_CYCAE|nr:unnamed protein product [Cyclocybe aegerita]